MRMISFKQVFKFIYVSFKNISMRRLEEVFIYTQRGQTR